jgi:hypothetical protein
MVLPTVRRTGTVGAASSHALRSPFLADEVGQCEAVHGDVGRYAVLAHAGPGESLGAAVVLSSLQERVADLEADAGEYVSM